MAADETWLSQRISAWIDDTIDAHGLAELQEELRASAEARLIYLEYMGVHAELDAGVAGEQYLARLADDAKTSSTVSERGAAIGSGRGRRAAYLAIAASVAVAAGLALSTSDFRGGRTEPTIDANVAGASSDCRWYVEGSNGAARDGFRSGDVLRVAAGKLQLHYDQGVHVTLHAPAGYEFISATNAKLILGRMTARVDEGGRGFTVLSPRAKVVDLGTEFGVEVKNDGATDVLVFQGEVDVGYVAPTADEARQQRLYMGEGVHVDAGGTKSRILWINSDTYSSEFDKQPPSRSPLITAVTDNISRPAALSFYEIVCAGMEEDALAFVDRVGHQYNGVDSSGLPAYLIGGDYVKTFNNDKDSYDERIGIDVTLAAPANLYVLLDARIEPPGWLTKDFTELPEVVGLDNGPFYDPSNKIWHNRGPSGVGAGQSIDDKLSVWVQKVPKAGTVHLGQLGAVKKSAFEPGQPRRLQGRNMYGIVAVPLDEGA